MAAMFFVAPMMFVVLTGLLLYEFGVAYLAGLLAVCLFAVLQNILARGYGKMRYVVSQSNTTTPPYLGNWADSKMQIVKKRIKSSPLSQYYQSNPHLWQLTPTFWNKLR